MTQLTAAPDRRLAPGRPAFLFDLDGTLVDSVYQHVLAWREAMAGVGIELAVWTIHRRIGMSGGLVRGQKSEVGDQRSGIGRRKRAADF